jgi:hypothetical protein
MLRASGNRSSGFFSSAFATHSAKASETGVFAATRRSGTGFIMWPSMMLIGLSSTKGGCPTTQLNNSTPSE